MKTTVQPSANQSVTPQSRGYVPLQAPKLKPRLGCDDGISNRSMTAVCLFFILLNLTVAFTAAYAQKAPAERILLRQAMLDIDRDDCHAAIEKLAQVFAADPTNANVAYLMGKCHLYGTGEYDKAVFYLERAGRSPSPDYEAWDLDERNAPLESLHRLAQAYEAAGHTGLAASTYRSYIEVTAQQGTQLSARIKGMIERSAQFCSIRSERTAEDHGIASVSE